jgi:positive regulator of sigma E activity
LRLAGVGHGSARPGDPVEVSVDAAGLVRAAGWTFGIPLAGLVTGAWVGSAAMGEGASIALGIIGLGFGIAWLLRCGCRLVPLLGLRVRRPTGVGSGMAGTNRRSG